MMPLAVPWTVLAREGQTCPWCAWEDGSETTGFALAEIALGQAVPQLGSCRLLHGMRMFSHVHIKLRVLWTESSSVWCCYAFRLARVGSIMQGSLSSASCITAQWGHFWKHNFSLNWMECSKLNIWNDALIAQIPLASPDYLLPSPNNVRCFEAQVCSSYISSELAVNWWAVS